MRAARSLLGRSGTLTTRLMSGMRPSSRLQLVLGFAQMFGASLGLVLLLTSGLTSAALGVAIGTTALTIASRKLFPRRDRSR